MSKKPRPAEHTGVPGTERPRLPDYSTADLAQLASLLIQLDPSEARDAADLNALWEALLGRAEKNPDGSAAPLLLARLVMEAADRVEAVILGQTGDPSEALAAAARLVAAAADGQCTPSNIPEQFQPAPQPTAAAAAPAAASLPGPQPTAAAAAPAAASLPGPQPSAAAATAAASTVFNVTAEVELLNEFLDEARDHLAKAEQSLLTLETHPEERDAIDTVFRAFHTIKGVSGFLDLTPVTRLAHSAESLLSRARDREILCTGGYANLALRALDGLRNLCEQLQRTHAGQGSLRIPADHAELLACLAEPEAHGIGAGAAERAPLPSAAKVSLPAAAQAAHAEHAEPAAAAGPAREGGEKQADIFVRVRTDRLDGLLDAVGELVIAQSMVAQDDTLAGPQRIELQRKIAHAGKIVRELQDLATSLRMVPLRATFKKMERIARDVALKTNKLLELVTDGEDTELDRNLVDVLAEPLVHMIRNACDHGIEPPDERRRAGKPERGTIRLLATHRGGHVMVELHDDGRGLNREKIVAKAIERGLISRDEQISDSDAYALIFKPGFSTAEVVTDLSGRGVGMDVVQRGIAKLDGRIAIRSEQGKGTVFSIRLPVTLAITDGMLVRVGAERFIIPTLAITTTFRPKDTALSRVLGAGEMVLFRDRSLPIFRLHRAFAVPAAVEDPLRGLLIVIGEGSEACAMLVDELLGQQQVVVKALGGGLRDIEGVSGGAILRDGRVGLILDPSGITRMARSSPSGSTGDTFFATPERAA